MHSTPSARDRALYERLYVARDDLRHASSFAAHLLKKGWHFDPWERRGSTYMQQSAYTTALVVTYARPFTESRGWPKFPKRLAPYDDEQKSLHRKILILRNEVYAHSDVARQQVRPYKILGSASAIVMQPSMKLTKKETEALMEMIQATASAIDARMAQLIDTVHDET